MLCEKTACAAHRNRRRQGNTDGAQKRKGEQNHFASPWIENKALAGVEGFEPSNAGIKIRCLRPAWRLPYKFWFSMIMLTTSGVL